MNSILTTFIEGLVAFKDLLMPSMALIFFLGITFRLLTYYTVKREEWFIKEFEKRLMRFVEFENPHGAISYFMTLKRLLEKTFYEVFEIRNTMRRRRYDNIMAPSDRFFLVQQGCAYMVRDTLKQSRILKKDSTDDMILQNISKTVLGNNPCFSRILGFFPSGPINDFTNILPGLFVVAGIFGTFLGIMKALPELGGMDLNDSNSTKVVMDEFLLKVAFSMATSTMGIFFSVAMQVFNSFLNPEKLFIETVDKYHGALAFLWKRCDNNDVPLDVAQFDEHRDPTEALAELAVQKEVAAGDAKKSKDQRRSAVPPPKPAPDQGGERAGDAPVNKKAS